MRLHRLVGSVFTLFCAMFAGNSYATVIDFNAADPGCATYTTSGVTFSATDGKGIYAAPSMNNTFALLSCSFSNYSPIRADFASPFSGAVSIDLGDYGLGFDQDDIFLRLYDSSNNLLASATQTLVPAFAGYSTLTACGSGVHHASLAEWAALAVRCTRTTSDSLPAGRATSWTPDPAASRGQPTRYRSPARWP